MKSIGIQPRDVGRVFLLEGIMIGLIGGLLGLGLAYVSSHLTGDYIRQTIEQRLGESLGDKIFAYPWWLIFATPLVATLVTTFASVIPARQAARVDPVRTLQAY